MSPRANTLDDFLAQVAALGEAHGIINVDFKQQVVLIEVGTVARNSVFDAQYVLRFFPDPAGRKLSGGFGQDTGDPGGARLRKDEIECWIAATIFPDDANSRTFDIDHRVLFGASR